MTSVFSIISPKKSNNNLSTKVLWNQDRHNYALIKNVKQYQTALIKIADCNDQANPIHLKGIARSALNNVRERAVEINVEWVSPSDPGDESD